jgi:hypothetical protein
MPSRHPTTRSYVNPFQTTSTELPGWTRFHVIVPVARAHSQPQLNGGCWSNGVSEPALATSNASQYVPLVATHRSWSDSFVKWNATDRADAFDAGGGPQLAAALGSVLPAALEPSSLAPVAPVELQAELHRPISAAHTTTIDTHDVIPIPTHKHIAGRHQRGSGPRNRGVSWIVSPLDRPIRDTAVMLGAGEGLFSSSSRRRQCPERSARSWRAFPSLLR